MTTELEMLLRGMNERIERIDQRTHKIDVQLAKQAGGERVRRHMIEWGKFGAAIIAAAFTGHFSAGSH
jgi:transposase